MGCCQTRDDDIVTYKSIPKSPKNRKSVSESNKIDSMHLDSSVLSGRSSFDHQLEDSEEKYLLSYIDLCSNNKRWEMIAPLITNSKKTLNANVSLSWTEKPKTVGAVALVHLAVAIKKYTVQVSPYIEVFLPVLLVFLKTGTMMQKEVSVFLLYYYVEFASERAIRKMLDSKIFGLICKCMISTKSEFRKYTMGLCYKLYKDRPVAKDQFIKANGAFYLVQLIGWNNNIDSMEDLVRNLEEIVMDEQKCLIIENLHLTKDPLTLEILGNLDLNSKGLKLRSSVDKLIQFYRSLTKDSSPGKDN